MGSEDQPERHTASGMPPRAGPAEVGIIANPASGKDIRRLVAHGSVFDNQEKANIVRRVLLGLAAAGVRRVACMPDYYGIGARALDGVREDLSVFFLEMPVEADQRDSTLAAKLMREGSVGCIITLGGDGTNRAVAKGCGDVPLVPISTGTNNVFPFMVEGTVAGIAAGVVGRGLVEVSQVTARTKRLEILRDGELIDIALIDAVVCDEMFVASRAVWDMSKVREMVLTRADPANIGLSSICGYLRPLPGDSESGMHVRLGPGGARVLAPVAPGLIEEVCVESYRTLEIGEEVGVRCRPSILALDGEREIEVLGSQAVSIRLSQNGPRVVDICKALEEAAHKGIFVKEA